MPRVICLDFEASGLGATSYPIEVAIVDIEGTIAREWLIKPTDDWLVRGLWDKKAEAIHGLTLNDIIARGTPAVQVARDLAAAVADAVVICDSPKYDGQWLATLFEAAGANRPPFTLGNFQEYAWQVASTAGRRPDIAFIKAEAEAHARFPVCHRAAADANHNAEFLRQLMPHVGGVP